MEGYKSFERGSKKIWYEENFRDWLKENRHLPDAVLNIINNIQEKGESENSDGIKITCIDINKENDALYSKSFKININNKNYFLKVESISVSEEGGFQEMESTLLAKDELESMRAQGVRVVEPLWGYEDQKEQQSYFVAEWLDLPILDIILTQLEKQNPKKADELLERVKAIRIALKGYREISPANMFYDIEKDEIVLFDLHV